MPNIWLIKSWPTWLWIGTPFKFTLWLINRALTATGVIRYWRWLRARRFFWLWLFLINAVSFGLLALIFYWLHHRT